MVSEAQQQQIQRRRAEMAALDVPAIRGRARTVMERLQRLMRDGYTLRLPWSSGKDSTVCVNLALMAARELKARGEAVPPIWISSSDTEVESPVVAQLLRTQHARVERWAEREGVDVRTRIVTPPLAQGWWVRILSGRKLPSYYDIQKTADCSVSLKVQPQLTLSKAIDRELAAQGLPPSVAVLGTRFAESQARASHMRCRGEACDTITEGRSGNYCYYTVSPIADWSDAEVFFYLNLAGVDAYLPAFTEDFSDVLDVYADAAGDGCMLVPDPALSMRKQAGCGARFGCFCCTRVPADSSLANLAQDEDRAYLRPLVQLRRFLMNIRWDFNRRYWVSRNPNSAAGDTRIMPHCFNLDTCELLMRCLLTIDRREQARAARVRSQLAAGVIENTARNRELAEVQFRNLTLDKVVAVDMIWSTDAFARPFHALKIYDEVWNRGIETEVPEVAETPRPEQAPEPCYVATDVGELWVNLGLVDPTLAMSGACSGAAYREAARRTIDDESLEMMALIDWDNLLAIHDEPAYKPQYAAHYYLRTGVVAYAKHYRRELDYQLRRGAWLHNSGLAEGLPPQSQPDTALIDAAIHDRRFLAGLQRLDGAIEALPASEPERQKLLKRTLAGAKEAPQWDIEDYRRAARRHVALSAAWAVAQQAGWRSFDGEDLEQACKTAARQRKRIARALDDGRSVREVDEAVSQEARDKALAIQRDEMPDIEGFGVYLVLGANYWHPAPTSDEVAPPRRQISLFEAAA